MSTVLQKPVILDETGQAIVGKLDEIKDAIDNGGTEKYPVLIHITTPPTKTLYKVGELIDYTGIVVKAVFSNNVEYDVTAQCSFVPAQGTPYAISEYPFQMETTATYIWHPTGTAFTASMVLPWNEVTNIKVTTPPTKTVYEEGETLDLTGIVVKKVYSDNSEDEITNECTYTPANGATLSHSDVDVTIRWTDTESPFEPTHQTWQSITVTEVSIYGAEWDGTSSPTWTRTDGATNFTDPVPQLSNGSGGWTQGSSPFDTISPWKDIKRVSNALAGELVEIPKFYYKWTRDGAKMKLQISPTAQTGFLVSPAHADRGDGNGERDKIYVSRYQVAATTYKSTSGVLPATTESRSSFRAHIKALGTAIYQWDFATLWTIQMLYLVEFASWDSQSVIGYGCGNTAGAHENTGATDNMTYHTGTTATSLSDYGHVQYRFIEDLWAGVFEWVDGIYFDDTNIYCILNPEDFSDTTGGTNIGTRPTTNGSITEWTEPTALGFEFALYAKSIIYDSNFETYNCDGVFYAAVGQVCRRGGNNETHTKLKGLFQYYANNAESFYDSWTGSRLMRLPNS